MRLYQKGKLVNDQIRAQVATATVRLTAKGGQGVLIPGGFVVTAAHCVDWAADGGMVLGDHHIEPVEAKSGVALKMAPWAVEPVNDIAVLGELDDQVFYDEVEEFREFYESTTGVPVCSDEFEFGKSFPVHVLTHHGTWIKAKATRYGAFPKGLHLEPEKQIEGGTSGGPIINDHGQLVGIVSFSADGETPSDRCGWTPQPNLTMPVWLWSLVEKAMSETEE